jgi:hypothetical protein
MRSTRQIHARRGRRVVNQCRQSLGVGDKKGRLSSNACRQKSRVGSGVCDRSGNLSSNLSSNSHGLATSAPPTKRGRDCRQCRTRSSEHTSRVQGLIAYLGAETALTACELRAFGKHARLPEISPWTIRWAGLLLALLAALIARPSPAAPSASPFTSLATAAGSVPRLRQRSGLPRGWLVIPRASASVPGARGNLPLQPQRNFHA